MRAGCAGWLLLLLTVVGCAGAAPPFDELPLRDTLRAEPDVVAALPDDARARLGARFQAAGAGDTSSDAIAVAGATGARLAAEVDGARQARAADALVVGLVGGGAAQALPAGTQARGSSPLPPLEGVPATSTADLEAHALNGAAGASLRELLAATHAQRLQRVVGWPVAAIALGDTVYVNGAWLVALAPSASVAGGGARCGDAGCDGGALDGGAPSDGGAMDAGGSTRAGGATMDGGTSRDAGAMRPGGSGPDAGAGGRPWQPPAYTPPPYTPPPAYTPPPVYTPPPSSDPSTDDLNDAAAAADGCAALADVCASADDGSADDSCSGEDDGSGSSDCSGPPPDEGSGGADCRTAPGRGHTSVPTMLWMFAPVAYLWNRKR